MARFEFKLPDIGEGVAEGEIVAWHVTPQQVVKEDQAMVEIMTDKATVTIGAPKAGTIVEILGGVGEVKPVGSLLVVLDVAGAGNATVHAAPSAAAAAPAHAAPSPAAPSPAAPSPAAPSPAAPAPAAPTEKAATAVGDIKETLPGANFFAKSEAVPMHQAVANQQPSNYFTDKPLATPAVRKMARDLSVDLRKVAPTGKDGRVSHDDVRQAAGQPAADVVLASAPEATAASQGRASAAASGRAKIAIPTVTSSGGPLEERKPFVGVRRKIAERMQTSKNTAAHFTFVEECDVAELKALRQKMKPEAEAAGVKLTFLPFITKAVVAALKKHPVLNSALDETTNELVYRKYFHIGIAASTDQGLMVPVVKDADRKSILEIAKDIERLGTGAKAGTLASSDLSGSTFTITSLGTQGGLFATPVLNFPEVGILGVHQIKQKPVVRNNQIVIGEIMLLSLSFDHRIVDGHVGAAFAYDIIGYLENPQKLFFEM